MKIFVHNNNHNPRDPSVIYHNGMYYHCFSAGRQVLMCTAKVLEGIDEAKVIPVFTSDKEEYAHEIWAPELHIIDNKCYIYVAMDDGNNYHHRMYVLENNSNNPLDPYKMHGKISDSTNKWAIDGTIVQYHNELFMVWSGWEGDENVAQNLYIAKMSDPYTISSDRRLISSPDEEFERGACDGVNAPFINEGPYPFYDKDDLYILYSGSGSWDIYYCLIALKLNGKDPMKDEWIKAKKPFLSSNGIVKGPGHCSVLQNKDKNYIFFHGWPKEEKTIRWDTVHAYMGELIFKDGEFKVK